MLDATLEKVYSSRGLTQLIERGMSKRQTGVNVTHALSRRSHAFLTPTPPRLRPTLNAQAQPIPTPRHPSLPSPR